MQFSYYSCVYLYESITVVYTLLNYCNFSLYNYVVYGWTPLDISQRTLLEQEAGYTFQVSFIKSGNTGASTTLNLNVTTEDVTASMLYFLSMHEHDITFQIDHP